MYLTQVLSLTMGHHPLIFFYKKDMSYNIILLGFSSVVIFIKIIP